MRAPHPQSEQHTALHDQHIEEIHSELTECVTDCIADCLDASQHVRLSRGEAAGIIIAVLTHELAALMIGAGMSEAYFLTWCQEHYARLQQTIRGHH